MNISKQKYLLLLLLVVFAVLGIVCGYFYNTSPQRAVNLNKFQEQLNGKTHTAMKTLRDVSRIHAEFSIDSIAAYPFSDEDISFYIFDRGELVFWSDNHLVVDGLALDYPDWKYVLLPNAHSIAISRTFDDFTYLALITVKYNYPYENDKLVNDFVHGFDLDKRVEINEGSREDSYPVFSDRGDYLFSLIEPAAPIFNEAWSWAGAIAYTLAFIVFFILYARFPRLLTAKRHIHVKGFLASFLGVGILISLLLYFNIPYLLFQNTLFSPFEYASGPLLASICHLSIFTGYILSSVYLFCFYVKIKNIASLFKNIVLLLVYPAYFLLLYFVFEGLVINSSIHLNILSIKDFSLISVWAHIILLLWGVGFIALFFKTHNYFFQRGFMKKAILIDSALVALLVLCFVFINPVKIVFVVVPFVLLTAACYVTFRFKRIRYNQLYFILWSFLYALFIVSNILQLTIQKNHDKSLVLAQNIYVNGNVENDRIADVLLEEMDAQLLEDEVIKDLLSDPDSVSAMKSYLDKAYFRGFWNKYDVQLSVVYQSSDLYQDFQDYVEQEGTKIRNTHFYSIPAIQNSMNYIGVFPGTFMFGDSVYYFMEFYPRRHYKSYSFPDLLIPSSTNINANRNITVAKYDDGFLTFSSSSVDYPYDSDWIPDFHSDYDTFFYKDRLHYIYKPNADTYIVVSQQQVNTLADYVQFLVYLALIYFILCWSVAQLYQLVTKRNKFRIGLASRFQYTFIALLIVSFVAIFYVSVDFIKVRYENQQIAILESKRNYIQEALQDKYYWNQGLDIHNVSALNYDLQELSYMYQTDIHVYDNYGILLGSSQPLIFSRNLISDRMAPRPYFSPNPNVEQYEHIGELDYLIAYTDFYNWDYLQIGYIAVPQFFSQEDMRAEIENFSSVIIHIYLIIIFIAILFTVFIGKRLSAPLSVLERKLREMRLGQRNEKVDYKQNDEIGQLVAQYNRTVDELEQSAKLLAKSERESAWKTMARQIAHEINNPLTPMKLSIQQLQRRKNMEDDGFDEYFKNSTAMLIEQIDNLSRIAGTFSNFARMPEVKLVATDISVTLQSVVRLFINNSRKIDVLYNGPQSDVWVYADGEQLIQVFNNLIKNAIQAIPDDRKGIILVDLQQSEHKVIIRIADNGSGIPEEIQSKMFVPNFTTKTQGMGLGLVISKNIIEQMNGTLTFETEENKGSVFIIELPELS